MPPNSSANNLNAMTESLVEEAKTDNETTNLVPDNGYGTLGHDEDVETAITDMAALKSTASEDESTGLQGVFRKLESERTAMTNASRNTNASRDRRLSLVKTQSSFVEDFQTFAPGSIPHSTVLGVTIGAACGVAAYVYYTVLFWSLDFFWETLPNKYVVGNWPEWAYVLWIPLICVCCALGVGLTVKYMGEPGDLPYTIKCVHEAAYVSMDHVMPMVCASQFSIIGGGSLGPEAPLVAICAAVGGFVSRRVFGVTSRNLVRKHTLMGMAGALAAFFGCPLGGSLFALEVNSRFGIEYFEHTIESIFAGEICLAVFRGLAGIPIESIWNITTPKLENTVPIEVVYGCAIGLIGALVAFCFAKLHFTVMGMFTKLDILKNERALQRALLGCSVIVLMGILVPHTMFWGEYEFQTISTMSSADTLEHVWPTTGLLGFEMKSAWTAFLMGCAKLVAISFTVSGGYRGGYIFPLMSVGAAFGRVLYYFCPFIPLQLCVVCMAAAINVGITRTALATTLIMAYLSGEQHAITALVGASVTSLFATSYMPFIKTQIVRSDLDNSLYYNEIEPEISQPAPKRSKRPSLLVGQSMRSVNLNINT